MEQKILVRGFPWNKKSEEWWCAGAELVEQWNMSSTYHHFLETVEGIVRIVWQEAFLVILVLSFYLITSSAIPL